MSGDVFAEALQSYFISPLAGDQIFETVSLLRPVTCPTRLYCSGTQKSRSVLRTRPEWTSLSFARSPPLLSDSTGELLS